MLVREHDLNFLLASSTAEITRDELEQADIVQVAGKKVPGGVFHPHKAVWRGNLREASGALEFIKSKRERKQVIANRNYFLGEGYHFSVQTLDDKSYASFLELYKEITLQKERAENFIPANWLVTHQNYPCFLIGMYQGKDLSSALLGSVKGDTFAVGFGAKQRFQAIRGGVGGVLELELLEFCYQQGIPEISHGVALNPSGIIEKAGVFEFKARYGFSAFPLGEWRTSFILNDRPVLLTDLVFITMQERFLVYEVLSKEAEVAVAKYSTRKIPFVRGASLAEHIHQARTLFQLDARPLK